MNGAASSDFDSALGKAGNDYPVVPQCPALVNRLFDYNTAMQNVVLDRPYEFVPPHRIAFTPWLLRTLGVPARWMKKHEGVTDCEIRNGQLLRDSLAAGHAMVLAPNHSRPGDPMLMGWVTAEMNKMIYAMASWHLFNEGWLNALAIKLMGGFSIYREGADRRSIETAIEILEHAERPLVLFPEGTTTRTNDRLRPLLDGVAFIARQGAKRREKQGGKVVIHPMGIKYLYQHDLLKAVDPVLSRLEEQITWQPQRHLPLVERIRKLGVSLLGVKELEYFGSVQMGGLAERQNRLIQCLIDPLEDEWFSKVNSDQGVVERAKNLRGRIVPLFFEKETTQQQKDLRWRQLKDIYLAQQLWCYPDDYLEGSPSAERLLETVERFEEDMTGKVTPHLGRKVIIDVGEAIEVSPKRDRKAKVDPLMEEIRIALESKLAELEKEATPFVETARKQESSASV